MSAAEQSIKSLYRYRFGSVDFDEVRFELRVAGLIVEVERKPLEVLALLLAHTGEVVTKEELMEHVWSGRPMVENVIANAVSKLRDALGKDTAAHIVTQLRVGYRLVGPVERIAVGRATSSALSLKPGDSVPLRPDFRFVRLLSASSVGEAWLAKHQTSREQRVFKFASGGEHLRSLKREVTLFRVLHNSLGARDDLVRIFDWNFESSPFFIECEYGGENLTEWAKRSVLSSFSLQQRLDLFLKVADIVAAAHDVGVLHKDIKPGNILIARGTEPETWQIRLIDFGSGRLMDPKRIEALGVTQLGMTVTTVADKSDSTGTLFYLAPELMTHQSSTVQSDLYALGILLYQLVVCDLRKPMVSGWEREIEDVMLRDDILAATEGNPTHRLSSVHALIERLRNLTTRHQQLQQERQAMEYASETHERPRIRYNKMLFALMLFVASAVLIWVLIVARSNDNKFVARQLTYNSVQLPILTAAISPNGNLIAFADQSHLFFSDENAVNRHPLQLPDGVVPSYLAWNTDNVHLLISGYNIKTRQAEVWQLSTQGSAQSRLLVNATNASISPDGSRLVFIRNGKEMWIAQQDGSETRRLAVTPSNFAFNSYPQFTPDGQYVIAGRVSSDDKYTVIEAHNVGSGVTIPILESDAYTPGFVVLPKNELLVTQQPDRGSEHLRVSIFSFNLVNGTHTESRVIKSLPDNLNFKFSATSDGQRIVCIGSSAQSDVYVADVKPDGSSMSNARRLTLDDSRDRPSGWLADNRTVLFHSDRSGRLGIYKQPIDSTTAELMIADDHDYIWPIVSADQQWLFYFQFNGITSSLIRTPLAGGTSELVDTRADIYRLVRCASKANVCVLADYTDQEVSFVRFDPTRGRGKVLAQAKWIPTHTSYIWDISPDGTRLAYIDTTNEADTIAVLDLTSPQPSVISVHVADHDPLRTLFWDAAGKGFYVSAYDTSGQVLQLLHVSLDGRVTSLRTQANTGEGWAIPSPDGKHLAFQQWTQQGNVWLLQRVH